MSRKAYITNIIKNLNQGLHEREELVAVALLAALAGQNTFLLGPPGTAKSLLARRVASAFESSRFFECLMNRFSTPEEIFGPVSLTALKQDRFWRKTAGYLPEADMAFLDEIWKSSPAILNTLLTLVNERQFRNGDELVAAPLKALVAASNELPEADQGLEALYDRFLVRLLSQPTQHKSDFEALLQSPPVEAGIRLAQPVSTTQWLAWQQALQGVRLSADTLAVIHLLRHQLAERPELDCYVSDRRWQRAALLLRASAYFNERDETNHSDVLLLRHCLWASETQRQPLQQLVMESIGQVGAALPLSLDAVEQQLDHWDNELNTLLFHQDDVYDTVTFYPQQFFFGGNEERAEQDRNRYFYVKAVAHYEHGLQRREPVFFDFYVHLDQMASRQPFHPVDPLGALMDKVQCQFDDQGVMAIRYHEFGNFDSKAYRVLPFRPTLRHHCGEPREELDHAAVAVLRGQISETMASLELALNQARAFTTTYDAQANSPFVPEHCVVEVKQGLERQVENLQLILLRGQQLLSLGNLSLEKQDLAEREQLGTESTEPGRA